MSEQQYPQLRQDVRLKKGDCRETANDWRACERGQQSLLAVFPLPLFILPGGVQRLKIFEPKYLTMVSEASRHGGFVIARYDKNLPFHVPNWGTKVEITDFNTGEDGLLLIDVKAVHLVTLDALKRRDDGLLMAQTAVRQHWCDNPIKTKPDHVAELGIALSQLFAAHPHLSHLYPHPQFDQLEWVCARFLEILPLSLNEKEKFVFPDSFCRLKNFLHTLILGQYKIN